MPFPASAAKHHPRRRGRPRKYEFRSVPVRDLIPDYAPVRGPSLGTEEEREDALLRAQIAKSGVQFPLVVTAIGDGRFRIVDGHRRYKAAIEAGLPRVPCQVFRNLPRASVELLRWDSQHANEPLWLAEEESLVAAVVAESGPSAAA